MTEEVRDLEGRMLRLSDEELVRVATAGVGEVGRREAVFAAEALRDRGFLLEQDGAGLRVTRPDGAGPAPRGAAVGRGRGGAVVRDVVIIWALTGIGGFVLGVAAGVMRMDRELGMLALLLLNLLLSTVGFTVAGCLAPPGRWRHLGLVAFWVWLTSLVNVVAYDFSIAQWAASAVFVALTMGVGGAVSYIFREDARPPAAPPPPPPGEFGRGFDTPPLGHPHGQA